MKPLWSVIMPTVTVKNIPSDLYEKLKQSAEVNRRSINRGSLFASKTP
jgi:hypothetical protein